MFVMRGALVVACALLAGSPAVAQQPPNGSMGFGYGVMPGGCGEYVRAPEGSNNGVGYSEWILGYLSAVNMMRTGFNSAAADVTGGAPNLSVLAWVRNWCRTHPLAKVGEAMVPLLDELLK
jgi:hypothetical protein